jgi:hypothetical protein
MTLGGTHKWTGECENKKFLALMKLKHSLKSTAYKDEKAQKFSSIKAKTNFN